MEMLQSKVLSLLTCLLEIPLATRFQEIPLDQWMIEAQRIGCMYMYLLKHPFILLLTDKGFIWRSQTEYWHNGVLKLDPCMTLGIYALYQTTFWLHVKQKSLTSFIKDMVQT